MLPYDVVVSEAASKDSAGSGVPAGKEIEVTPEMIEAGRVALAEFAPLGEIDENSLLLVGMVREVLIAAFQAREAPMT